MTQRVNKQKFYILSGSPSAGKTTVLTALKEQGYAVVPEAARLVIAEFEAKYGKSLLDTDKASYCQLLLNQCALDYQDHIGQNEVVFFDRGLPDVAFAERMIFGHITVSTSQRISQQRYNTSVFFFPPWQEIYQSDHLRPAYDGELYRKNYRILRQIYSDYGYQIIEIPKVDVHEREDFIIKKILPDFS